MSYMEYAWKGSFNMSSCQVYTILILKISKKRLQELLEERLEERFEERLEEQLKERLKERFKELPEERLEKARQREDARQQEKARQREEALQRYNELLEHMRRVFSSLSTIWQKFLDTLSFFCNFSGFPHKYRPPCTTMPWNIWPSLVVLWGVCWMFCNPVQPIGDAESWAIETGKMLSNHLYVPSSATGDFHVDTSNVFTEQHQPQHSSFLDQLYWDFSPAPLYPEGFDLLHAYDTQPASTVGGVISQYPDQVLMPFNDLPVGSLEDVGQTYFNNQYTTSIAGGHQNNGNAQMPTPLAIFRSASEVEQTTVPPCKSTKYKRTQEPPQNTEGRIVCNHSECSNLTFARRCDWK